jgi:hypothetical protein
MVRKFEKLIHKYFKLGAPKENHQRAYTILTYNNRNLYNYFVMLGLHVWNDLDIEDGKAQKTFARYLL